jgi:hypothetical protein
VCHLVEWLSWGDVSGGSFLWYGFLSGMVSFWRGFFFGRAVLVRPPLH